MQFQQLRDLVDPTLRPSERKHYSESPCLWTAATVPFLVAAPLVSIAEQKLLCAPNSNES